MSYVLALGDPSYSSWSLRIGLLVAQFELPVSIRFETLYTAEFHAMLAELAPARTVPALQTPEGVIIAESLAIAEELATRFPDRGLWPADPAARAMARGLAAEMHADFSTLREVCPMNLRKCYAPQPVSAALQADLDRLQEIWDVARARFGDAGPWLCGTYSIADAFFAPVAARIAGYSLPVRSAAQSYVHAHLAHPAFRTWRAEALRSGPDQAVYARAYPERPWPDPVSPDQS